MTPFNLFQLLLCKNCSELLLSFYLLRDWCLMLTAWFYSFNKQGWETLRLFRYFRFFLFFKMWFFHRRVSEIHFSSISEAYKLKKFWGFVPGPHWGALQHPKTPAVRSLCEWFDRLAFLLSTFRFFLKIQTHACYCLSFPRKSVQPWLQNNITPENKMK